jgi:hypothetical protein
MGGDLKASLVGSKTQQARGLIDSDLPLLLSCPQYPKWVSCRLRHQFRENVERRIQTSDIAALDESYDLHTYNMNTAAQ